MSPLHLTRAARRRGISRLFTALTVTLSVSLGGCFGLPDPTPQTTEINLVVGELEVIPFRVNYYEQRHEGGPDVGCFAIRNAEVDDPSIAELVRVRDACVLEMRGVKVGKTWLTVDAFEVPVRVVDPY